MISPKERRKSVLLASLVVAGALLGACSPNESSTPRNLQLYPIKTPTIEGPTIQAAPTKFRPEVRAMTEEEIIIFYENQIKENKELVAKGKEPRTKYDTLLVLGTPVPASSIKMADACLGNCSAIISGDMVLGFTVSSVALESFPTVGVGTGMAVGAGGATVAGTVSEFLSGVTVMLSNGPQGWTVGYDKLVKDPQTGKLSLKQVSFQEGAIARFKESVKVIGDVIGIDGKEIARILHMESTAAEQVKPKGNIGGNSQKLPQLTATPGETEPIRPIEIKPGDDLVQKKYSKEQLENWLEKNKVMGRTGSEEDYHNWAAVLKFYENTYGSNADLNIKYETAIIGKPFIIKIEKTTDLSVFARDEVMNWLNQHKNDPNNPFIADANQYLKLSEREARHEINITRAVVGQPFEFVELR